ncbi:hypothetical protein [Nocardiopsis alkaliphila]|uniref:hypothetical protein n=1 Tax=Nocardiopsis alkaliphila TaxID=225762 RepID=UPI000476C8CA|nr:hypothetical protein [Nocardiopsis alkaliphila]
MNTLLSFLAVFARLLRPSQATHGSPYGRVAGILEELRRNRSRRVRRYAEVLPTVAVTEPFPAIPAPRKPAENVPAPVPCAALVPVPADHVPVVDASSVAEPAAMVRGYYREWERRKAERYADRQWLGMAVLCDVAAAATSKVGA